MVPVGGSGGTGDQVDADLVRLQIDRITASDTFASAPILCRLLRHVAEYALTGRADELKEYALGVEVFDRGVSFDPRIDAIVRVQARRLRSKLDEYYSAHGTEATVVVELPKGHYIPRFRRAVSDAGDAPPPAMPGGGRPLRRSPAAAAVVLLAVLAALVVGALALVQRSGDEPRAMGQPRSDGAGDAQQAFTGTIAVARLEDQTEDKALGSFGWTAADAVIRMLAKVPALQVQPHPVDPAVARAVGNESSSRPGSALAVTGAYSLDRDRLHVRVFITDLATGRVLHGFPPVTQSAANTTEVLDAVAQQVAGAVAIHFDTFLGGLQVVSRPPRWDTYQQYRAGLEVFHSDYPRSLSLLERASKQEPEFLLPLVVLHFLHANRSEHHKAEQAVQRLEQRLDSVGPAERLLIEFMRAAWEQRRPQALRLLEELERWNPESLFVNHNIVEQSVQLNRPRRAVRAFDRLPLHDTGLRHSVAVYRIDRMLEALHMIGDYDRELKEVERAQAYAPGVLRFAQNQARALAALGRLDELTRLVDQALAIPPAAGAVGTVGALLDGAALELRAHGHQEESERMATRAVQWWLTAAAKQPATVASRTRLGIALYAAGDWKGAGDMFRDLAGVQANKVMVMTFAGQLAARSGQPGVARAFDQQLAQVENSRSRPAALLGRARIAALLGDREGAVNHLRAAFAAGLPFGSWIHNTREFESLREFPPYLELIRHQD
jgi:tetratricopeptide (TPR) repeat protein